MSPAYEYIGKNMVQAGGAAASHALSVVSAERGLGLFHEQAVQALFIRWDTVTDAFNAYYGGTHFLVPALALGWLLPGSFGIADTLRDAGPGHVESTLITTAGDQYASMPSLHVAWAVWCALALYPVVRHRWLRVLVAAYPVVTTLVVVATGNHFFLDALAGTLLAGLTWAVISRLDTRLSFIDTIVYRCYRITIWPGRSHPAVPEGPLMMTSNERSGLTEPIESVTRFFGMLMIIAALVGVAFLVFGSGGTYGGLPGNVCVTQPGTEYSGSGWNTPLVTARPGHSVSIIGAPQVCADHATLGEQALGVVAALPAVLFWGGVLFMLWRIMVTARRNGPFTRRVAVAVRRLGWFIIIGSTAAAVVHLIAVDTLLTTMATITNPFPNLIGVPLHLPIPLLTGAALLTFARIVTAGAAMDAEIQATI